MNANSQTIIIFCSHLCVTEGIEPLSISEWSKVAEALMNHKLEPKDILNFTEYEIDSLFAGIKNITSERLMRLMDRSAGLFAEVSRYKSEGINIYTRADKEYPVKLKIKLKQKCPPLFYCAGDISISELRVIGYAGSRNIDSDDEEFTRETVRKTCKYRYGVVSGGARGVDAIAAQKAFDEHMPVIEYIAGGLTDMLRKKDIRDNVIRGNRLILSEVIPDAGFSVGNAMSRNKYIYAHSEAAVIIKSDLGNGGTWTGAIENIKHGWTKLFCRDKDYPGNRELIRMGAIAINEDWNGDINIGNQNHNGQLEISFA
ncbi:MAG: DNA-processing protein DprA [Synergistaceae bacterium]|nr:DNA-processing protein DprA [Synergistaceae bacterium]MBR0250757.1 DNA-processing protein DprA [Synergistaceae bacterium]